MMLSYEEYDELSMLSLALLASRLSRLIWKAKTGRLKTVSKEEIKILREGKKFISRVKDGSMMNQTRGKEGYLPDLKSLKAYNYAREAWSPNGSFLDKLDNHEKILNYIEENKGLPDAEDSNKMREELDEAQFSFIKLSDKLRDLVEEGEKS